VFSHFLKLIQKHIETTFTIKQPFVLDPRFYDPNLNEEFARFGLVFYVLFDNPKGLGLDHTQVIELTCHKVAQWSLT
jgi:hypothetical protein